jgi:hypothetical protein
MLARCVAFLVLGAAIASAAVAQWTPITQDPLTWPYGDSKDEPTDSQMRNLRNTFAIFANGYFNVVCGRCVVNYQEGLRNWAIDNRHSHFGIYDPASDTWQSAGTQRVLQFTGSIYPGVDELTFYVDGDITGIIFVDDWILGIPEISETNFFGKVETITYDGDTDTTTVVMYRIPDWRGWIVPPDWIWGLNDTLYTVTVLGLTGPNDATGTSPPQESYGYSNYASGGNAAAYDTNGGSDEIFVFGGYPHWLYTDIYDYDANSWWRGAAPPEGAGVYEPGAQVGSLWVGHLIADEMDIYDLASDFWQTDPVGTEPAYGYGSCARGFPDQGMLGTVYFFMGNQVDANLKTKRYEVMSGTVTVETAPPVTGNYAGSIKWGDFVILFGGLAGNTVATSTDAIQIYNTLTDTWCVSTVKMPYKAYAVAVGVSPAGTVYLCGGRDETGTSVNYAYKIPVTALFAPGIKGVMNLDSHVAPQNVVGAIEMYDPGGAVVLETISAPLDASGNFQVASTLAAGTYDVRLTAPNFLAVRVPNVVLPTCGAVDVGTNFMVNGDGDASNQVDLPDLNAVLVNFGKPGPTADYNGDGTVDILDMNIVFLNFGKTGDS